MGCRTIGGSSSQMSSVMFVNFMYEKVVLSDGGFMFS